MRKSLIQQMYKAQYKDQLQKWYNMWADAMKDGSDGGTTITDKEQEALDSLKNSIIHGATDAAQKINEQFKTADDVLDKVPWREPWLHSLRKQAQRSLVQ